MFVQKLFEIYWPVELASEVVELSVCWQEIKLLGVELVFWTKTMCCIHCTRIR